LQNLIGNAVKFTPPGGRVLVSAEYVEGENAMRIAITDSGPGISDDVVGRLFDKFATGRIEGSGTGLGLAFCKLAVEAHGGRIWVESQSGEGSTFAFLIPVKGNH
jgi:signal transduction histidine kinase